MIETVEKKYNPISNEFDTYKIIKDGVTYYVPLDPDNIDYQAIQEWIEAGNTVIDNPPE
jgi:hypothetical protein